MKPTRSRYYLGVILLLGLILRLVFFAQFSATPFYRHPLIDGRIYHELGQEIASGRLIREKAFFMGPLYPYCLGFLYAVTGPNPWAPRLAQMLLGLASIFLLYLVGRRLFSVSVGLLAALFFALYQPVLFYEQTILMETSLGFVLLFLLFLILKKGESSTWWWLVIGCVLGAAALFRGNILLLLPTLTAWLFVSSGDMFKKNLARAGFLAAGTLLLILPALVHNLLAEGDFVILSSNSGINFFIGNNEKATGFYEPPPGVDIDRDMRGARAAEADMGRSPLKSSEISRYWRNRAFRFIRRRPFGFLKLLLLKFYLFWGRGEPDQIYSIREMKALMPVLRWPLFTFLLLGPLALIGMLRIFLHAQREKILLILFILCYLASLLPFFITARYRLPVIPLLCLPAAAAAFCIVEFFKQKKWMNGIGLIIGLAVLILILDNSRYFEKRQSPEVFHNSLGLIYKEEGRLDEAMKEFRRALDFGEAAPVYSNIANIYYLKKDYTRAIEYYQRSLGLNPGNADAHFRLGRCHIIKGEIDEALARFERTVSLEPDGFPRAHFFLAILYLEKGEKKKAERAMRTYLRMRPGDEEARKTYLRRGGKL